MRHSVSLVCILAVGIELDVIWMCAPLLPALHSAQNDFRPGLLRCVASIQASGDFQVDSVILPDGEEFKNLDVVKKVWDKALETRLPRHSTLVALGGGVIGDMTGYAAACYQRGTDFMQVCPYRFPHLTIKAGMYKQYVIDGGGKLAMKTEYLKTYRLSASWNDT